MLGMLLALMKHLDVYSRNMSQGIWKDAGGPHHHRDATTLVLGLGSLALVRVAHEGLGSASSACAVHGTRQARFGRLSCT
jgi:phosphoglycerate dehydrogenase-like enzyme